MKLVSTGIAGIILVLIMIMGSSYKVSPAESWIDTARISGGILGTDMTDEEMKETVDEIHQRGQSVILTWVPNPLLEDWVNDLEFCRKASAYIHSTYSDLALIVYQGPLEIVTPDVDMNRDGKIDLGKHSIYTDHPEWLQVGIDGRKAVFYGDKAFWIGKNDEDVWLCPNDQEYKEIVTEHFYELAHTGIDGIWVDIPKFLCDFGDWDSNWACHCEDCQQQFYQDTGLTIPQKVDWSSHTWKAWVLWRQKIVSEYIRQLNTAAKSANPHCALVVEHWHGINVESVREAWSPILLREVTDCLAHEYAAASYNSSTYDYYNYLRDIASYLYYRGVDREHPSWVLAYSSHTEGQRMLAASVLTAGCNFYDTDVPHMAGSVSLNQQQRIFHWIKDYSPYYYQTEPWANVAVYYSKPTMDFLYHEQGEEGDFYCEFMGVSMMLLSLHIPYNVIFSLDTVDEYHTVVLPNAACMSDEEVEKIHEFVKNGGKVLATGESGQYDEWGIRRSENALDPYVSIAPGWGADYYRTVRPYNHWWIPENRGDAKEVLAHFSSAVEELKIPQIFEVDAEGVVVLPFVIDNTVVFKILNLSQVSRGSPVLQEIQLSSWWPLDNGNLYPFLSSFESIENPAAFTLYDHAVLTFNVTEPVTVISNSHDSPAAEFLVKELRKQGFLVEYESGCRPCLERLKTRKQLIILGGHKAQGMEWLVGTLLTEENKQLLEQEGAHYIFVKYDVFSEGQMIIIAAGDERESTYQVVQGGIEDILRRLA